MTMLGTDEEVRTFLPSNGDVAGELAPDDDEDEEEGEPLSFAPSACGASDLESTVSREADETLRLA